MAKTAFPTTDTGTTYPSVGGRHAMAQLRAIIFDVDGTLADTERTGHLVAYNLAFADLNLPWRWTEQRYTELLEITGGRERLRHFLLTEQAAFAVPGGDLNAFVARLHAAKNSHYEKLLSENAVPLRPGVRRLLLEARASGMRLAIATASQQSNVMSLLRHNLGDDAPSWFEVIMSGDQISTKKPAPDVYQAVLRQLRLPTDEVLAVEDSEQGLQAALTTGIKTLVTTNYFTARQNFHGAVAVLDHLGEPGQPCHATQGAFAGDCVDLHSMEQFGFDLPADSSTLH